MPNRPASSPVIAPATRIAAISSRISPNGTPEIMSCQAAAVRAASAPSPTNASASRRVFAPAPGLTASVARWRRKARAPGTAWKSPSTWRVMGALEPIDAVIVERWDVAVLARREAIEPGLARMHDEGVDARRDHDARERIERFLRILVVDADAAFDGHRNPDRRLHGGDAIADEARLRHQTGAEPALLHAIGGAADIEIDLVVAEVGADARALRERRRVGAAELQRHRMLRRIEAEQARAIAAQHRARRDHLGIDQRAAREQAVEEPAVPVGPLHHGGDAEARNVVLQCRALSSFSGRFACAPN